mgnify:CR=1 FL=1
MHRMIPNSSPVADVSLAGRPIALIGFMGVGKTAVGKRLARLLGFQFLDTDSLIEQKANKPISVIFAEEGQDAFRRLENEALREALRSPDRVVSTGGGITLREENRDILMGQAVVVLLTATPVTILRRVQPLGKRPLLLGFANPLKRIEDLLKEREEAYANYHFLVDTTDSRPDRTAASIAGWYNALKQN